jgi:hypothetical protein
MDCGHGRQGGFKLLYAFVEAPNRIVNRSLFLPLIVRLLTKGSPMATITKDA